MNGIEWGTLQWQLIRPYGRQVYYSLFPQRRPEYFHESWRYPGGRLGAVPECLPAADQLVCFFLPMNDWHARMQRSQQLAKAIAGVGGQAVYVNPHLGLEYVRPYAFDPYSRVAKLVPGVYELHVHLPREHELDQRLLTQGESARVAREIGRLVEIAGVRQAALIVSFPAWLEVADRLHHQYGFPIIYDCHDWLPGFRRISPAILEHEHVLFRQADLVVFSSQPLMDRVLDKRQVEIDKSVLIRNATEPFAKEVPIRAPNRSQTKTVGYVGALDHWFDVDAVAELAAGHPDWRVVLAGRVEHRGVLELQKYPNVDFVGEIPRSEVEAQLRNWDAAMIPFLVNELTWATNPIKLYEYFSAGLPVISSRLPEIELYKDLVYLADDPRNFSAMVDVALMKDDACLREKRIDVARHEVWPARATRLLECIMTLE